MFWIIATFAVSAISITLTRSSLTKRLRKWFNCHYCMSHWVSLAIVTVYQPVVGGLFWIDLIFATFALVGSSALLSGLILFFTPFNSGEES